jgi:hypothetical protein
MCDYNIVLFGTKNIDIGPISSQFLTLSRILSEF